VQINTASGLVSEARHSLSPNYDARPDPEDITGIIIHSISLPPGEYGGPWIEDFFLNQLDPSAHPYFGEIESLEVSAHLLIRRDGELVQFVPFHRRAWHAGASQWAGRDKCNDFTIGIELEGDEFSPFTVAQYQQLATVIIAVMAAYPKITADNITGHEHVAPGRKTDPGPHFDWELLTQLLQA
jgi:AmpD protein